MTRNGSGGIDFGVRRLDAALDRKWNQSELPFHYGSHVPGSGQGVRLKWKLTGVVRVWPFISTTG